MAKKELKGLEQRITITIEGDNYVDSFSTTKAPLTADDAIDWFTYQVLPSLGYSIKEGE